MRLLLALLSVQLAVAAITLETPSNITDAINIGLVEPLIPHTHPKVPKSAFDYTCIDSNEHPHRTSYDDYWHTHDIFCRHVVDKKVVFSSYQTYNSADSLCNSERCIFISLQFRCVTKDDKPATFAMDWDMCMKWFLFPYWGGAPPWRQAKEGDGPCAKEALKGASVVDPDGCWNFSSVVWETIN